MSTPSSSCFPASNASSSTSNSASSGDKACNVNVVVRCRPPNERELASGKQLVVKADNSTKAVTVAQGGAKHLDKTFSFDAVYGPSATQSDIYQQTVSPVVEEVLDGFNCTIFAYGMTSTGKTYTMEGSGNNDSGIIEADSGVIPRAVSQIFRTLERNHLTEYAVRVSCLELYNEELIDLLSPEEKKLSIYQDSGSRGVFVSNLEEIACKTALDIHHILREASHRRQICETQLNRQSSRSHVITTITIHMKENNDLGEELIKIGKLNLVDLAGSENIGRSGAVKKHAKEAGLINQSLLTLGRVITALVENQPHIPYRESKLTRLLQESLGGRAKTTIIATVSPSAVCVEETLSTLDYAFRAKYIRNRPQQNQKTTKAALIRELTMQMEDLKAQLRLQQEKNGGTFVVQDEWVRVQAALESKETRLEEIEAQFEEKEKQFRQFQELYSRTEEELEYERSQHSLTKNALDQANQDLESTRTELQDTIHNLEDNKVCLEARETVEEKLLSRAESFIRRLKSSLSDVDLLHQKIDRKHKVQEGNRNALSLFESAIEGDLAEMASKVVELKEYRHAVSHKRSEQLHVFQQIHADVVQNLHSSIHALQSCSAEAAKQMLSSIVSLKNASNAGQSEIEKVLDSFSSTIAMGIQRIEQNCSRLTKISEDHLQSAVVEVDKTAVLVEEMSQLSLSLFDRAFSSVEEKTNSLLLEVKHLSDRAENVISECEEHMSASAYQSEEDDVRLKDEVTRAVQALLETKMQERSAQRTSRLQEKKCGLEASRSSLLGVVQESKTNISESVRFFHDISLSAKSQVSSASDICHSHLQNGVLNSLSSSKSAILELTTSSQELCEALSSQSNDQRDSTIMSLRDTVLIPFEASSTEALELAQTAFDRTAGDLTLIQSQVEHEVPATISSFVGQSLHQMDADGRDLDHSIAKQDATLLRARDTVASLFRSLQEDVPTGETPQRRPLSDVSYWVVPSPTTLPRCLPYAEVIAEFRSQMDRSESFESVHSAQFSDVEPVPLDIDGDAECDESESVEPETDDEHVQSCNSPNESTTSSAPALQHLSDDDEDEVDATEFFRSGIELSCLEIDILDPPSTNKKMHDENGDMEYSMKASTMIKSDSSSRAQGGKKSRLPAPSSVRDLSRRTTRSMAHKVDENFDSSSSERAPLSPSSVNQ